MLQEQSLYSPQMYDRGYWPMITYHYSKTWTEYNMPMHWHASVEVMYVFMGHCHVFVRDQEGRVQQISMRSGDFVLLDANVIHRLKVERDTFCYMLNVELAFSQSRDDMFTMRNIVKTCAAFAQLVRQKRPVLVGNDVSGELFRALNALQNTYLRVYSQPANRCVFDAEMAVFLIQLGQAVYQRRSATGISVHVKKAIQYIENHFDAPILVPEIAAHAGIHPAHLQRVFRENMHMTIGQYLTRLRMDKATRLLESTHHISISEIARLVGYQSRQHFAQVFKKTQMITPQAYKKEYHRVNRVQYVDDLGLIPHYGAVHPGFYQKEGAEGPGPAASMVVEAPELF